MPLPSRPRTATLVATNLGAVIKQQGRTLTWFGQRCDLSRFEVARICSGKRRATPELARRSSDLLGVPIHLLFDEVVRVGAIGADAT